MILPLRIRLYGKKHMPASKALRTGDGAGSNKHTISDQQGFRDKYLTVCLVYEETYNNARG